MAAKHATLISHVPEGELFSALVHVVQQGDYDIGGLSNELRELLFRSKPSPVYVATVVPEGSGSVLQLTVGAGGLLGLMGGKKYELAAEKLIEAVESAVAAPAEARSPVIESFAVLEDGSTVPWTSGEFPGA